MAKSNNYTDNVRLNAFFGERENSLYINMGREYLEGIINMRIFLYRIDAEKTETHDFYGTVSASRKVWKEPVELKGLINLEKSNTEMLGGDGPVQEKYGNIIFSCYQEHLDELQVEISVGDYFKYIDKAGNQKFFEIVDANRTFSDNESTMFGFEGFTRNIKATAVEGNVIQD